MNYIITEEQNKRLVDSISDYIKKNLTPHGGWDSPKEYRKELKLNGGELFMFLEDTDGFPEDSDHMWYSTYENVNTQTYVNEEDCPFVLIPDEIYGGLDGYFGDLWKPVFIEWFQQNTKLPLKTVDEFGWTRSTQR